METKKNLVVNQKEKPVDVFSDFFNFIKEYEEDLDALDKSDAQKFNALFDKILFQFSQGRDISEEDLEQLREALEYKYVLHASADEGNSENVDEGLIEESSKETTEERMQRIEQTINPEEFKNAAKRYAGWVAPYEKQNAGENFDEKLLKEAFDKFCDHTNSNLIEERGNIDGDAPDALKIVLKKTSQIVQNMTEEQKAQQVEIAKKRILADQKEVLAKSVKKISEKWKAMDFSQEDQVQELLDELEANIRAESIAKKEGDQKRSLLSVHIEQIVKIARDNLEKRIAKKKGIPTQVEQSELYETEKTNNIQENSQEKERFFECGGLTYEGTHAIELKNLQEERDAKNNAWYTEYKAFQIAKKSTQEAGLDTDFSALEARIEDLSKEFMIAKKNFEVKILEYSSKNEKDIAQEIVEKMRIDMGIERNNQETEVRAENVGGKIKEVLTKTSQWFKKIGTGARRVATTTFVTAGLAMMFGGSVHKENVADVHAQVNGQSGVEQFEEKYFDTESSKMSLEGFARRDFSENSSGRELPTINENVANEFAREHIAKDRDHIKEVVVTVGDGDTLWDIITEQLQNNENYKKLSDRRKLSIIKACEEEFAAMSSEKLKSIGFETGNIHEIKSGYNLNLTDVMGNMQKINAIITAN
ncbi:MAG: hypothetical protein CR972_02845 [Candidatus Moraniibacteriota bacterium]|nr:MAG: hypothetical protein CR972_02845 [Candidatus Moranbacteria bacterium]